MSLFRSVVKFGQNASRVRSKLHRTAEFAITGGLPQARGIEAIATKGALTLAAGAVHTATKTDTRAIAAGVASVGVAAWLANKLDW